MADIKAQFVAFVARVKPLEAKKVCSDILIVLVSLDLAPKS